MIEQLIGPIILGLLAATVAIALIVWLLHALYHRTTMEVSFVRTGLGGDKVVIKGGALVLPIIHEITPVGMSMTRTSISCAKARSIITKDRMRIDLDAEFYLHVLPQREAVAAAAATLGRKTMEPDALAEFFASEFESALRAAGAEMTLEAILANRPAFIEAVVGMANQVVGKSGLVLDAMAISNLDQTELEHFNPANRFDAEGLTELISVVEERRKLRNDIEQEAAVAIRQRNLDAEKKTLELERDIEASRAVQKAEIAREQAVREAQADMARIDHANQTKQHESVQRRTTEEAEILSRKEVEASRISSERELDEARVQRELNMRKLEIDKSIQLHEKETAQTQAQAAHDQQAAKTSIAQEKIQAATAAEQAMKEAEVNRIRSESDAQVVRTAAEAERQRAALSAEAERLRNEADNVLDSGAREGRIREKTIDQLLPLVRESVKPLEKIDSIKVVHVGGMGESGKKSPTDEVIDSALRYRVQAPMIDELMKDLGVKDSKVAAMGDIFRAAKDAKSLTVKPDDEKTDDK